MSTAIFRGTTLGGTSEREVHLYEVNDRIVIALAHKGRIIDVASIDLDMADSFGASVRHRVLDVRMAMEARRDG